MKERKPDILFSDSVKEIMGTPPGKIVRWGTFVLFAVFILFLVFSRIIRYPDVIPSEIEITTQNPPVTISSKITGRIERLYVGENDTVHSEQLLAVMETTASVSEIEVLRAILDTLGKPETVATISMPEFSELGELQEYYSLFLKNIRTLSTYDINDFYGNKVISLETEIKGLHNYISNLNVKEKLLFENQKLELNRFRRDSVLFSGKAIPQSTIEISQQSLLKIRIELQEVKLQHADRIIEIAEREQILQDYRIKRIEERETLVTILRESFFNLKAQLKIWEDHYLLISPVTGSISFTKYWNVNQSVVKDDPVMNVIPINTGDFLGRIYLGMYRSGKVKAGQKVNIKLSGYPYLEFGIVSGIVKSKSLVPSGDTYVIEVLLPDGLKTIYGYSLDFNQNMQGTAEIITDDLTLLQKILNPFRYMISRNRR